MPPAQQPGIESYVHAVKKNFDAVALACLQTVEQAQLPQPLPAPSPAASGSSAPAEAGTAPVALAWKTVRQRVVEFDLSCDHLCIALGKAGHRAQLERLSREARESPVFKSCEQTAGKPAAAFAAIDADVASAEATRASLTELMRAIGALSGAPERRSGAPFAAAQGGGAGGGAGAPQPQGQGQGQGHDQAAGR
eukprot:tig00000949_g5724.t1